MVSPSWISLILFRILCFYFMKLYIVEHFICNCSIEIVVNTIGLFLQILADFKYPNDICTFMAFHDFIRNVRYLSFLWLALFPSVSWSTLSSKRLIWNVNLHDAILIVWQYVMRSWSRKIKSHGIVLCGNCYSQGQHSIYMKRNVWVDKLICHFVKKTMNI